MGALNIQDAPIWKFKAKMLVTRIGVPSIIIFCAVVISDTDYVAPDPFLQSNGQGGTLSGHVRVFSRKTMTLPMPNPLPFRFVELLRHCYPIGTGSPIVPRKLQNGHSVLDE